MTVTVFGEHDDKVLEQLTRCTSVGDATGAVLCADAHLGYSMPIGGVVAYDGYVSPSGVGFDVACGNKAVLTNLKATEVGDFAAMADEINRRVSFGVGRVNNEPVDHAVLDQIREADVFEQRALYDLAAKQLGTVGAGNHYVDLFADEQERIWIGVHFGSRGFGHRTATGFLNLAAGRGFTERGGDERMGAPPTLLPTTSDLGWAYVSAMELAGAYAYAGRDVVCDTVLDVLGATEIESVHNNHNFAWAEEHDGRQVWVVRKGATPAFPMQKGFVGGSMGEDSVILEGVESPKSRDALYSTVHGAGRAMSRTKAAGKFGKVYECTERDCSFRLKRHEYAAERERRGLAEHERFTLCPDHPEGKMKPRRARVKPGLIDFDAVRQGLTERGIVLRGGAADEAPGAYKRLDEVLEYHEGTVRVLHRLRPLVVVMAGPEVQDPYKD